MQQILHMPLMGGVKKHVDRRVWKIPRSQIKREIALDTCIVSDDMTLHAPSKSISCSCATDNKSSPSFASTVLIIVPFESSKWILIL